MTIIESGSLRHDLGRESMAIPNTEATLELFRGGTGAWIVWHPNGVMERFETRREAEVAFDQAAALLQA